MFMSQALFDYKLPIKFINAYTNIILKKKRIVDRI